MALEPHEIVSNDDPAPDGQAVPLAGTHPQRMQRLQVGLFGLGMMLLLVGLANIVLTSAQETKATVPTEIATTSEGAEDQPAARDPLADAGVVPDLPAEPEAAEPAGPTLEEQTSDLPPPPPAP